MLSRRVVRTCFQYNLSGRVLKTVFQEFISVISYIQNRPDNTKIVTQVSNRVLWNRPDNIEIVLKASISSWQHVLKSREIVLTVPECCQDGPQDAYLASWQHVLTPIMVLCDGLIRKLCDVCIYPTSLELLRIHLH